MDRLALKSTSKAALWLLLILSLSPRLALPQATCTGCGGVIGGTHAANDVLCSDGSGMIPCATSAYYWNGNLVITTGQILLPDGSTTAPSLAFGTTSNMGLRYLGTRDFAFVLNNKDRMALTNSGTDYGLIFDDEAIIGWSASAAANAADIEMSRPAAFTIQIQSPTGTTGDTKLILKEGAATSNNLLELQANDGTVGIVFSSPTAMVPKNSEDEPEDCTSAIYGALYYDTSDNMLCVCANDGAIEWQKVSDMTTDCTP